MKKWIGILIIMISLSISTYAQNYSFDFNTNGRRVCLVNSIVDSNQVKILFLDSAQNTSETMSVSRRIFGSSNWTNLANNIPAGSGHWIDNNVNLGEDWEYQIKRQNTWNFQSQNYDATGYTIGCVKSDHTQYKGQIILLVSNDIPNSIPLPYENLKRELNADGWYVNELIVPRAQSWDSGNEVVTIKNQIVTQFNSAPANDKPKILFILGHVPLPRSGSNDIVAPDDHSQNKGARGCDAYYADIDGIYTDTATYNPGGLSNSLAINFPGDFKWDQDIFPSDIEMALGRIDFADLSDISTPEMTLIQNYLQRLSDYKNVKPGYEMGDKSAFYFGYNNSNDGSFRSLPNISRINDFYQNYSGANHNQWVQNNGPFKIYMQNQSIPEISDWQNFGMNATVFASDQSYWGFGDVPQPPVPYSRIRALLGLQTKCLVTLWTTTGINIFHQACTGEALGLSLKTIMNHNSTNQYLEKAPQQYDTQDWWNRTHFAFYGDPTLNLYQIAPPSNISLSKNNNNQAVLQWNASPDTSVTGYHIFKSDTETGKYIRITTSATTSNQYIIPNYQVGEWYMVKAVKMITSGCGQFLHGSLGIRIQGNILLNTADNFSINNCISIVPNPLRNVLRIESTQKISEALLYDISGKQILRFRSLGFQQDIELSALPAGLYILKLYNENQSFMKAFKLNKID